MTTHIANVTCPICLGDMSPSDMRKFTAHGACRHAGHIQCVENFAKRGTGKCPLCRHELKSGVIAQCRLSYDIFEFTLLGFVYQERARTFNQDPPVAQELTFIKRWCAALPKEQRSDRYALYKWYFHGDRSAELSAFATEIVRTVWMRAKMGTASGGQEPTTRTAAWCALVSLLLLPTAKARHVFDEAFVMRIACTPWVPEADDHGAAVAL